jgi:tetratricopeptide (TPR) repeat protein
VDPDTYSGNSGATPPTGASPQLMARLTRLERQLTKVYENEHCRGRIEHLFRPAQPGPFAPTHELALTQILAHLGPLIDVLIELGYFDVALSAADVARSVNPTAELAFTRGYLLAVLGDTEEAAAQYGEGLRLAGSVPESALTALRVLIASHPDEEDLSELLAVLSAAEA